MKIFDPKLTGSIEIQNTITGNVTIAGGLTVEGSLGGGITGSATASYVEYSNIANKPTLLSGSQQIADDISGSFLLNTTDTLTGDLTVTGTLTAQDLHVQEVTSSIVYSSGSNIFGASSSDIQTLYGSVGIGTTTPSQLLTVWGGNVYLRGGDPKVIINNIAGASNNEDVVFQRNDSTKFSLGLNSSDYLTLFGSSTSTAYMTINSSGGVGIATNNPTDYLEIKPNDGGDVRYIKTHFTGSSTYNNASANTEERVASGLRFGWYSDYWQIGAARSGDSNIDGFIISDTGQERMVISNSGNVGIGTNNVTTKLTVRGSGTLGKFDSDQSYVDILLQNTSNTGYVNLDSNAMKFYVGGGSSSDIAMAILNNGDIGIGTTTPFNTYSGVSILGADASIAQKTTSVSGWTWSQYVNSSGTNNFSAGVNHTIPYWGVKAGAGMDNPHLVVSSTGNVGIRTNSPDGDLHIYNTATSARVRIGGGNGSGNSRIFIQSQGDSSYIDSYGDNAYKHLSIQANRLLLNTAANTGNVGINTTAPKAKFEVAGDVLFRDDEINLYTDTSTAAQWVKIYEKESAATVDYLHFELKTYNNAEFSAEVKIHVGSYSGFSTGYGNLTNGQGINCDIIHAGLNSQTNILESIVEVADLGSTSTYTKIYLKIDPAYSNTVVTVRNYADATKLVETTNSWSTTDPSTGLYTRSFPFRKNNRSINNTLNIGSNGNIGIGGVGSNSPLYVSDGASPYSTPNDLLALKRNATNGNDDTSRASIQLGNNSNGFILAYGGTTDRFRILDGGTQERVSVLNGGAVGIGTTSPQANLDVNEDLRVNRYHKNIFKYHTTASVTNQYFHIKTGVGTNQVCMHMYHVEGYAYGQNAILDERFAFHTDSGGSIYGKSYKGSYANNIYKSSDNKVVLVFGPINTYYTSFMVHLIESGMYSELFVKPTAATYSSSNSGAY